MQIGNKEFEFGKHTYVMGILNMTPDSFSDGGKWNTETSALFHVETMIKEGASIIDVGGESTRPGFLAVSQEEEIRRTAPIIEKIKRIFDIPVSIDTSKVGVAREALSSGADLVNDVSGLFGDPEMGRLIARTGASCCLMHNGHFCIKNNNCENRTMKVLLQDLQDILKKADEAGIDRGKVILDPGVGFGKTPEGNMTILAQLPAFEQLGVPMLLGTSRKSVIGYALDLPIAERVEGTMVTSMLAAQAGFGIVRVHDVKENVRAIKMVEALRKFQ